MKKLIIAILAIALLFTGTVALSTKFGWFEEDAPADDGAGDLVPIDPTEPNDPTDTGTNTPSDTETPGGTPSDTETPEEPKVAGTWVPLYTDNEVSVEKDAYALNVYELIKTAGKYKLVVTSTAEKDIDWNVKYWLCPDDGGGVYMETPIQFSYDLTEDGEYTYEFESDGSLAGTTLDTSPEGETVCDAYTLYLWVEDATVEVVRTWENNTEPYDILPDIQSGGMYLLVVESSEVVSYVNVDLGGTFTTGIGEAFENLIFARIESSYAGYALIDATMVDQGSGWDSDTCEQFEVGNAVLYKIIPVQ